ncbi:Vps26 domain containing protein, partial [Asbolus verrucosus]
PIQLIGVACEVSGSGRLPSGSTEIPFEIPLKPKANRVLYETYHGVYINISYAIRCDIKRSFLSKDLQKGQQFLVQYWPRRNPGPPPHIKDSKRPVQFKLSPATLAAGGAGAPDFILKGQLDATCCSINKPFTGHVVLEKCVIPIRSVELQLVRVETCGCAEGYAREATEIQNIQIGDGDIPPNIDIPIYMVFPRLFTCPTLITNFKIEFEINLVIVF